MQYSNSGRSTSALGHQRRGGNVRYESALPPIPGVMPTCSEREKIALCGRRSSQFGAHMTVGLVGLLVVTDAASQAGDRGN
jgi:hypothetical protein